MQSRNLPATESSAHVGGSSAEARTGCGTCGKTPEQTTFTNSQQRRLKRGKPATCKLCADAKQLVKVIPPNISPTNNKDHSSCRIVLNLASYRLCHDNSFPFQASCPREAAPAETAPIASTSDGAGGNALANKAVDATAASGKMPTAAASKPLAADQVYRQYCCKPCRRHGFDSLASTPAVDCFPFKSTCAHSC